MDIEIWNKYKENPTQELRQQIILGHLGLVHYIVNGSRFIPNDLYEKQDYLQFGVEGLSEAVDRFDPKHGTKFETYAIPRIRGKIIDEIRKVNIKHLHSLPINSKPFPNADCELIEVIPNGLDTPLMITEREELKSKLREVVKKIGVQSTQVLHLYYEEGLKYREIARILNVTKGRISQIHKKMIAELKLHMTKFYN